MIAAENCELITLKEQSSASCQPFSDCSGLFCADTKNTSHVRFTVDNCEDPVLVNATFHHFETVNHVFNGSSTISLELEEEVSWNMSRNASHLFVQATLLSNGTTSTLVPFVTIGLNASGCMCDSINAIPERGVSPYETDCVNNTECTGLECNFSIGPVHYKIETEVQSCANPPGFIFLIRNVDTNLIIFNQYFDSSKNTSIPFGQASIPLGVMVHHRKYSMIISISVTALGNTFYLVPESQIILDKTHCEVNVVPTSPTAVPSPTSKAPTDPKICNALKNIAQNQPQCTTNPDCDTVICNTLNYESQFQVLPCHDPPGLHVRVYDENNELIYDKIVTNSTEVPLSESLGISLMINFQSTGVDTLELEVKLVTNIGTIPVVPKTQISYDHCLCLKDARGCSDGLFSTVFPSSSSIPTTRKNKIGYTLVIEIVSPIVFVFAVIIISAVILICCIIILKKKRSSQISFRRLSVQADDDDNADL